MPCRVTFYFTFQGDRLAGWSENFWNSFSPGTTLNNNIGILGNKLIFAKGNGVIWTRTRVSIPGQPRNGYTLLNDPPVQYPPSSPTSSSIADYQTTKWLLQLSHTPFAPTQQGQNSTKQWFGGVQDSSIVSAAVRPAQVIASSFPDVAAELTTASRGWIMWQLDPAFPGNPIKAIDPATGIVTCSQPISFGTATLVRVSRVVNLTYANGLWTWTAIPSNNTQVQLNNWTPQTNVMKTSPKATIRPQNYAQQTIVNASVIRASNHKVGRPIGQFGGRQKKPIRR